MYCTEWSFTLFYSFVCFDSFGLFHYSTEWIYHGIHVNASCLSVFGSFGLFQYRTKWIYQLIYGIFNCLSVLSCLVCFIAVLNVCVQIDSLDIVVVSMDHVNFPW